MWPKQSRKSPRETSTSPLPQPALMKISYVYSGSPDSPCIRRSVPRLSNSEDIKRNLRNITDDDYDQGYSTPAIQASFCGITSSNNVITNISSSPCNSVDSGFQSPLSSSLFFNLPSQLNSSSPLLIGKEESQSSEEKGCEVQVTPSSGFIPEFEISPSSASESSPATAAAKYQGSTECPQLIVTTPVQDRSQHHPKVNQNVLSTSAEKPGTSSVKIIYLNSLDFPSSSSSSSAILDTTSFQSPPLSKEKSPPKDIVIEILKSQDCQTPKLLENLKSKEASCTQTSSSDQQSNKRPSHSYEKLIKAALDSRPDKKMTLKEIRHWVENTYPFYKNSTNPGWKDAIRHNLSVSKLFVKESPKYGSCWKLASSLKEPTTSPQVSSGVESQAQLSNSNSAVHVFNTVNNFPTGNTNPQSRVNVPSVRQKGKLKKKGPLPILPRLNMDPQTYVLVPLQYFCNPVQNNIPIMPQLPSTQNTSGSSSFVTESHAIAQSTSSQVLVTSTPISTSSNNIDITAKDFLAYQQSPIMSPLATNQISSPNPSGQTIAKIPVLQTTVQPSCSAWSPDHSKPHPKRICAKNTETKSKTQESPSLERSVRRQKLPSDRKSRRKQRLVYKDMSPMDSSHCDGEITFPENDKISSQLPQTPTTSAFNALFSMKTPSPSMSPSPGQILLPSEKALSNNALISPTSQKLMFDSCKLSPNCLDLDTSLKDGNLSDSISLGDNEFWELLNYS